MERRGRTCLVRSKRAIDDPDATVTRVMEVGVSSITDLTTVIPNPTLRNKYN